MIYDENFEKMIPMFPEFYTENLEMNEDEVKDMVRELKETHAARTREVKVSEEASESEEASDIKITKVVVIIGCHGLMNATFTDGLVSKKRKRGILPLKDILKEDYVEEELVPTYVDDSYTWFEKHDHEIQTHTDEDNTFVKVGFSTLDLSMMNVTFSNSGSCAMLPTRKTKNFMAVNQMVVNDAMNSMVTNIICSLNRELDICGKYGEDYGKLNYKNIGEERGLINCRFGNIIKPFDKYTF